MPFIVSARMPNLPVTSKRVAVLGADSFIGSHVLKAMVAEGYDCNGTTRRADSVGERMLHLDLLDDASWTHVLKARPDVAIAFFAVSKLDQCESDPVSREINAERVPALLEKLADAGCRVVFLSTNSIFGGERELCDEDAHVEPKIAYSRQKDEAEQRLLAMLGGSSHAVVRISRTISAELPPFDRWLLDLRAGRQVEAFDDFIFAPMTTPHVASGLLRIALSAHDGIFHLSGTDVSYFDLALEISSQMGAGPEAVVRTNSAAKGVSLRFRPSYSALGMRRTTELLGIERQSVREVASHLIASPH
jgi:dTDP-4-dehydrorhamnose reductase